jgi:hypothetical protein
VAGLARRRPDFRTIRNIGPISVARIPSRIVARNSNLPLLELATGFERRIAQQGKKFSRLSSNSLTLDLHWLNTLSAPQLSFPQRPSPSTLSPKGRFLKKVGATRRQLNFF